ncbi:DUF6480 family protein [Gordonia sp. NPDC062954]|jgi:hypothetical protein|uniref:DUF6480 family protein n=1 Tax=unclassified Gordonia (in: high G+C Gram-positive bacteria) TaxID=2657482 RepID=UPI000C5B5462|nr:DUF6480 family protein [Gordonia sp. (in: high G+C Gram-positive bacteria)]MAU83487.1 hypothetical protein [Gordonia sp. (in: high G+C Gram-positive bacteria)]
MPGSNSGPTHDPAAQDPDPTATPDLEKGGGVAPGDTPPDTAQTSGLSHHEDRFARVFPVSGIVMLIGAAVLIVAMIAVAVGLITML